MNARRAGLSVVGDAAELPAIDERAHMVREVLAGRDPAIVAAEHSLPPHVVERWVAQFLAAGGRALAARAVAHDETADHLLAIVSHEIRSPLTSASMALRLLAGHKVDDERRTEIAELVARQLDVLSQLADDVLDGASVALGRLELKVERVDLVALVDEVAAEMQDDNILVMTGAPIRISGDPRRLRQIVANILYNAQRQGAGAITVEIEDDGGHATISVVSHSRDVLSAEDVEEWFEPFAHGSSRTGHGLGFYVVRALTVAHAGMIGVDSLPCEECVSSQNLRVWVRLPVVGPPPKQDHWDGLAVPRQVTDR